MLEYAAQELFAWWIYALQLFGNDGNLWSCRKISFCKAQGSLHCKENDSRKLFVKLIELNQNQKGNMHILRVGHLSF